MSTGNELDQVLFLTEEKMYTDSFRTKCICGFSTDSDAEFGIQKKLPTSEFQTRHMNVLFKSHFIWRKAKNRDSIQLPKGKLNTTQNFWSKQDMGWLNMNMQAALMLGVLQGMDLVIGAALKEDEDYIENKGEPAAACEIKLRRVINDNFYGAGDKPFKLLHIKWSRNGKSLKTLNPDQLEEIKTLTGIAQPIGQNNYSPFFQIADHGKEAESTRDMSIGVANTVKCPVNGNALMLRETAEGAVFLLDGMRSMGIAKYSEEAFIFQKLLEKLNGDDSCVDSMNLPNKFEHGLCKLFVQNNVFFSILYKKEKKYGEWEAKNIINTVAEYWKFWCPMIAWKGPWLNDKYEAAPKMFNYSKKITEIYGGEFLNNGPLEFFVKRDENFDGVYETIEKDQEDGDKEQDDQLEEDIKKEKEEEDAISEITPENIQEKNQQNQDKIDDEAKNQTISEQTQDDNEEEEEDEIEFSEIESEEEGEASHDIEIEESDEEKKCNKRREMLEEIYGTTGYKPKNEKDATEMIANMMGHPHDIPCKHVLPYEITAGEVFLIDPSESVMKYIVKKITPQQLKVAGQDPNFDVYQIHFKNHMFDDEMDSLYYIPAREMANEWDKFPNIMMKFCDFSDNNLGSKLYPGLVYTEFFKGFAEFLANSTAYNFKIETGASGPLNTLGSSTKQEFEEIMADQSLQYITYILRINNNTGLDNGGFYDVIFQCWILSEKYLMVKMSGTQLNYQVMINKYATADKLGLIFAGMRDALRENFLDTNTAVVSIHKAKQLTFDTMVKICQLYKFTCTENSLDEDDGEPIDNTQAHFDIIAEEDNKFMFAMYSEAVEKEFSVRGFIHTRENIPVMNIFFTMDIFQSEYIIPLVNLTDFTSYLNDIFHECYKHLYYMMEQIYLVEDPSTTEEELDKSEALGRYTMKKLVMKIFGMLSKKYVYGCIKKNKVARAEITEDGRIDDSESAKKRLKWMKPEPFDETGDFVMLRSNNLYRDHRSVCQAAEMQNPLLLELYSTHLDERNGYALTINNLDKSQKKDVKTTYHFVKYQDYAHMRVFENFIGNIFNQLFDSRPEKEKEKE